MDKYDLLVAVHQIKTTAIKSNCPEIRDFCENIFAQLTDEEQSKYLERLNLLLIRLGWKQNG